MQVNASTLVAIQQSFNALFQSSLMGANPLWPMMAMEIKSTHRQELHQWLGRVPQMRLWIDKKDIDTLRGFQYTISNKDYESTIAVDRNDVLDDMLGLYMPRVQELGVRAAMHGDKLLSTARQNGHTTLCYDGLDFYDTSHAEGDSGTQSNYLQGTGVTTSAITADFFAARAALMSFKDDRGEPYIEPAMLFTNMEPQFICTVPPALWGVFDTLFNAQIISQTSNVLYRAARLVVDSRLTDTNDWYLDYVGGIIKPFIHQTRQAPYFVSLVDPNTSERVFMQKEFLYGVEERGAVDYGLWQYSAQTHN